MVGDSVVGVCVDIVEELFSGGGLLGSDFTEGNNEFVVDGSSIEEEGAGDALDSKDADITKRQTGWSVHGVLDLCSVVDFGVFVGGKMRLRGVEGLWWQS